MKKPRMVHIKWRDSYALKDGWGKIEFNISPEPICETLGFLVNEDKNYWFVSLNISHPKDYGYDCSETIMIPKVCVVKKRFIK